MTNRTLILQFKKFKRLYSLKILSKIQKSILEIELIKKLNQMNKNQSGIICSVEGDVYLKRRLLELGFVNGTEVKVLRVSPLKQTFLVTLRNYTIALRSNSLSLVSVVTNE